MFLVSLYFTGTRLRPRVFRMLAPGAFRSHRASIVNVAPCRARTSHLRLVMRCYFMRDGKIKNVEMLRDGPDEALIQQAKLLFEQHKAIERYDGFEVWSGKRFVYREPSN